jgi:acetyltransferase
MIDIRTLDSPQVDRHATALSELLIDAVDGGASVGFLPPLSRVAALAYWQSVGVALRAGDRVLLAAFAEDQLVGSVQLDCPRLPNASHRAEVMKLFVQRSAWRQGLGRALMARVEAGARSRSRSLLVLDTRLGDAAEQLYAGLGYQRAGQIPGYARSADGRLDATVIMYRWLGGEPP